jgi:hydrogenase expression/formation protein HypC
MCLGIPGRIVAIADETRKLALIEISGVTRQVNVACVAPQGEPLERLVG